MSGKVDTLGIESGPNRRAVVGGIGGAFAASLLPRMASSQTALPKRGGILRVGIQQDFESLEGHTWAFPQQINIVYQIYDRLIEYGDDMKPTPRLAESWEFSDDQKRLKFNLRHGVQFHNGREFTSEDVKYNLLRVRDRRIGQAQFLVMSSWWTSIETPDKYTIVLVSDKPRPGAFDLFEMLNMLDKDTADGPDAKSKAIGTGPFALVEWKPGVSLTLTRNKNYWQKDVPFLDGIVAKPIRDVSAMMLSLEVGELDLVINPPVRDVERLNGNKDFRSLQNDVSGRYYCLWLNSTFKPFDNKLVRQAVNFAVDRKRIAERLLRGFAQPKCLLWPKSSPAYDAAKDSFYSFDLDKAKALLAQAGITTANIEITHKSGEPEYTAIAQILQADLAKIGINAKLSGFDRAAWQALQTGITYRGMTSDASSFGNLDPASALAFSSIWNPENGWTGLRSDEYRALLSAAATEPVPEKRKVDYAKLNDFILDQSVAMPVCSFPSQVVMRSNVQNVRFTQHEALRFLDIWIA